MSVTVHMGVHRRGVKKGDLRALWLVVHSTHCTCMCSVYTLGRSNTLNKKTMLIRPHAVPISYHVVCCHLPPLIIIPHLLYLYRTSYTYTAPLILIPHLLYLYRTSYTYTAPLILIPHLLYLYRTSYTYTTPLIIISHLLYLYRTEGV